MGGKTRNIAIQLVMQQCCKIGYTFFLPVFLYLTEASDGVELTVSGFFFSVGLYQGKLLVAITAS